MEDFDLGDNIRLEIDAECDAIVIPFLQRTYHFIVIVLQLMIKYFDNFKNPVYVAAECLRHVMEQLLDVCRHLVTNELDVLNIRNQWAYLPQTELPLEKQRGAH